MSRGCQVSASNRTSLGVMEFLEHDEISVRSRGNLADQISKQ